MNLILVFHMDCCHWRQCFFSRWNRYKFLEEAAEDRRKMLLDVQKKLEVIPL